MPDISTHPEKEKTYLVRRDAPVVCIRCGRMVPRKARQQQFCSDTCRERARERSRKAFVGRTTGAPTNPPKKLNGFNQYGGPKSRSSLVLNAVQTEVFAGRDWHTVASSDGVVSEVSTWRARSLINTDGGSS